MRADMPSAPCTQSRARIKRVTRSLLAVLVLLAVLSGCMENNGEYVDKYGLSRATHYVDDYTELRLDVRLLGAAERDYCRHDGPPPPSNRSTCIIIETRVKNYTPYNLTVKVDEGFPHLDDRPVQVWGWEISYRGDTARARTTTGVTAIELGAEESGWITAKLWFDHSGTPRSPAFDLSYDYSGTGDIEASNIRLGEALGCSRFWDKRTQCEGRPY